MFCFNPHSCTRSDNQRGNNNTGRIVSIHTPVQGVTIPTQKQIGTKPFQSTLLYKEWRGYQYPVWNDTKVSIHTPVQGVTLYGAYPIYSGYVSIHTPVQGVTVFFLRVCKVILVSIHTPVQGVTIVCSFTYFPLYVSIHTPVQGVTP